MKLLEKFRWLPTEIPWPGTAEVSAKSWLDAVLVGETPGNEQREIQEVAAVERQIVDFGLRNGAGDLAARGFQHGRPGHLL